MVFRGDLIIVVAGSSEVREEFGLFTPFHVACAGDHAACVRALCAAGSDTAARNDAGQTGWDLATYLERADVSTLPLPPSRAPLRVVDRLPVLTRCGCR